MLTSTWSSPSQRYFLGCFNRPLILHRLCPLACTLIHIPTTSIPSPGGLTSCVNSRVMLTTYLVFSLPKVFSGMFQPPSHTSQPVPLGLYPHTHPYHKHSLPGRAYFLRKFKSYVNYLLGLLPPKGIFWEVTTAPSYFTAVPLGLYPHSQPHHEPSLLGSVLINIKIYVNRSGRPRPGTSPLSCA